MRNSYLAQQLELRGIPPSGVDAKMPAARLEGAHLLSADSPAAVTGSPSINSAAPGVDSGLSHLSEAQVVSIWSPGPHDEAQTTL